MKRLLILLLTGLFAQLVVSCYPEGADNVEDYDVAITNYDKSADFSAFTDFAISDSIVYFSNDKNTTFDHQHDQMIIDLVKANLIDRGYTLNADPASSTPSFVVTISAFSNVNYVYFVDNWYNNWNWYWGSWWPNWGYNPYYPWYPVNVYSYRTGSVAIEMVDTKVRTDNKLNVVWTGIADGLLQGGSSFIQDRVPKEINQCFAQSPYLMK